MTTTGKATADGVASATEEAMTRVATLDFTLLKGKLAMQKEWTDELISEIETSYRQFLALNMLYPTKKIVPTLAIDEFWHAHILDTRAYTADCKALFGDYMHHYPYSGLKGALDMLRAQAVRAETQALFKRHFGVDPFEDGSPFPVNKGE